MHKTIVNCWIRTACYGLGATPGVVVFSQDNDYSPTTGEMHPSNGQRDHRDLIKVKCFKFQYSGHFANKSPTGAKIGETHENVVIKETSDDDMGTYVYLQDIHQC